jgi:hypothetical protein
MRQISTHQSSESNPVLPQDWPSTCINVLKIVCSETKAAFGSDEAVYAEGLGRINRTYFNSHPEISAGLIAVIRNRALQDHTRIKAIDTLLRWAEPDPNIISAQIARGEARQAERGGAPELPSPHRTRPARPYTLAVLDITDDRSESAALRWAATNALKQFQRSHPPTMATGATEMHRESFASQRRCNN